MRAISRSPTTVIAVVRVDPHAGKQCQQDGNHDDQDDPCLVHSILSLLSLFPRFSLRMVGEVESGILFEAIPGINPVMNTGKLSVTSTLITILSPEPGTKSSE